MPPNQGRSTSGGHTLVGGGFAGVLAGILMGVAVSAYAAVSGNGWSYPMQMVAAVYYGPMAFVGGAGVTTIGVFTYLAIAAVLGAIFAMITPGIRSVVLSFFLGIIYSIAIWAFMTYVTLVVINETMGVRVALTPMWWFFVHWIYGGMLGIFMPAFRPRRAIPQVATPIQTAEPAAKREEEPVSARR